MLLLLFMSCFSDEVWIGSLNITICRAFQIDLDELICLKYEREVETMLFTVFCSVDLKRVRTVLQTWKFESPTNTDSSVPCETFLTVWVLQWNSEK